MERFTVCSCSRLLLVTALLAVTCEVVQAQRVRRVYNPITGKSEIAPRRRAPTPTRPLQPSPKEPSPGDAFALEEFHEQAATPQQFPQEPSAETRLGATEPLQLAELASYCDSCVGGDPSCDSCLADVELSCGDACGLYPPGGAFYAGFIATYVKPRFENNAAFTVEESDGASFESISDTEFDYDLEFTPRVFLGWRFQGGNGLRVSWWQFDNSASIAAANPPANGFGSITHPTFGGVDISSTIATDTFTAATDLNAFTIDLEATKEASLCGWEIGVAGGIRYASAEQGYFAEVRDAADVLLGQIAFGQQIEGFGPTLSLAASRPLHRDLSLFVRGRASVLFGDGESTLAAIEDADLATPFNTTATTNRDDVLSIAEIQIGLHWQAAQCHGYCYRPFLSTALEGQIWNGAGNATSEEGTLGFYGFNTAIGVSW